MKHLLVLVATLQLSSALTGGPQCIHDDRLTALTEEQVMARNSLLQADPLPELKGIYYINLATSALRRGRISTLLKMTSPKNMMIERFEAVGSSQARKANLTEFTEHGIHD